MGNTKSSVNVVSGLKRLQEDRDVQQLYRLVDLHGGGELLPWMKYALGSGDYNILDGLLDVKVKKYMYNGGKGRLVPVAELVKMRNQERNALLGALRRKKGKGKSGPNILEAINQDEMQGDMLKALKFLDGGGGRGGKGGSKYREVCWDTSQRGAMGENLLHICLLQGTAVHNELAKRLVLTFPKLVNDIFLSEDYYGNTPLHQAIVNEDPEMVRFLLRQGADVHQRCYGAFFCPDDQRASRNDSLEHEWVDMSQRTDYTGRTYWGETPLAFAACTEQESCVRLLRAWKADPSTKDTNGNTVLHLMVIHELPDMFDLVNRLGGKLHIMNNQNLTPLTLAAKRANKTMFEHVLTSERDVLWSYGDVSCAAYPLAYIDTIDQRTGKINRDSALALIVYGESNDHLDLLDGLMEDLLEQKWRAYAKQRLTSRFIGFLLYFFVCVGAFILRPYEATSTPSAADAAQRILLGMNDTLFNSSVPSTEAPGQSAIWQSVADFYGQDQCHLMHLRTTQDKLRIGFEAATVLGMLVQTITQYVEMRRMGSSQYLRTLEAFPSKAIFLISFKLIIIMIPLRLTCWYWAEHVLGILAILCTSLYFLFFCRGMKFVGPFVLMVYKIIVGDMARFFIIYLIFVIGFSQSFYIIFLGCHRGKNATVERDQNILATPHDAFFRMFIMSIGEFAVFYKSLNECRLATLGKVLFVVFELFVSIMLINLLIAMMARTYQEIAETEKEWKRQWAKVILMLEQSLRPRDRLLALLKYSRPIGTDKTKRAFVVKWRRTTDEHEAETSRREEQLAEFREEKRAIYKRKLQGDWQTTARRLSVANGEDGRSLLPSSPFSVFTNVN